jgi:hypothetical protein
LEKKNVDFIDKTSNKEMLNRPTQKLFLYFLLVSLAIGVFLFLAFTYAHQLPSRVDEGSFLIKGYYFWTGRYRPFEDYGPWTNNMPLAYYIPGLAQYLFGPGLRTGRYFMIFLTLMTFTALFLLVFRLKGKWWALFTVLPLAFNPSLVAMYVQAVSEGVVAFLLSWMMFFLIGTERNDRQIALGAMLGGLTILTRQNMILLIPFVVIYAFWLHGKRAGWIAVIFSVIPVIIGHLVFFPDIFKLWFAWLPGFIKRAFEINMQEGGGTQAWKPEVEPFNRIASFFITLRYHFIPLFGFFLSLFLLPLKKFWQSIYERRLVLLLSVTFLLFFVLHAWASLTKNYCVFCFSNYVSFFIPLAVLAGVITISSLLMSESQFSSKPILLFFLVAMPGTFLGNLETVGRWVMALPFPRLKGGRILSGTTELWKLFENRFEWTYDQLLRVLPPIVGSLATLLVLAIFIGIFFILKKFRPINHAKYFLLSLLAISLILTPTSLLGGENFGNSCSGDVLASYEQIGDHLQTIIPDGSTIYWGGGSVVTPLLYITNTEIHPPQLNGIYSARRGGDRDLLEKAGYYNEESRNAWRESDEFILVNNINLVGFWKEFLIPESFNEYKPTGPLDPCNPESFIRIYRRK